MKSDLGGGASASTEVATGSSTGTDVSLREYVALNDKWLWRFWKERDRRYTEVQRERDKAEVLRAANQAYRDEKANELREQISSERGDYASKTDLANAIETITATLKPLVEFVAGEQGARQGGLDTRSLITFLGGLVLVGLTVYFAFN